MVLSVDMIKTADERRIALELRHRVFTREMGRTALAVSDNAYTDEFDVPGNSVFLARLDGVPIGTLRLCLYSTKTFWDAEEYKLDQIGEVLGVSVPSRDSIGLADRGVIVPEARGRALYDHMWLALFRRAQQSGLTAVVGIIDSLNQPLRNFHGGRGWTTYRERVPIYDLVGNFIAIGVGNAIQRHSELLQHVDRELHSGGDSVRV